MHPHRTISHQAHRDGHTGTSHAMGLSRSALPPHTAFNGEAGTRVIVEVEVIEGDSVKKSNETITFDENRFRIDFPEAGTLLPGIIIKRPALAANLLFDLGIFCVVGGSFCLN